MLHYELVFSNAFKRRESKWFGAVLKVVNKVMAEQVITLQVAQ